MIEVEAASKVYVTAAREIWAVRDISLSVGGGEFVSIVGPSGCGKSTLLNMIAGFEAPTAGEIRVAGARVAGQIPGGLGYIFQKDTVLPWYTVRQNIALGLRYRGRPASLINEKVGTLATLAGLEGFEELYPHELSGGMRRRLALVMTLACDPTILLLDEPFGALDTHTKTLLHMELLEIRRRTRQTIVLVTHDLGEAVTLSDRVIVLSRPPSRILMDQSIDFPEPRDVFSLRETEAYAHYYQVIWKVLGQEFRAAGMTR
jgi:NitT/TauT family transport system ATP-binding protein